MRNTFCDHCGEPMGDYGQARLVESAELVRVGTIDVTISVVKTRRVTDADMMQGIGIGRTMIRNGSPDLCRSCILHAVKQIEDLEES